MFGFQTTERSVSHILMHLQNRMRLQQSIFVVYDSGTGMLIIPEMVEWIFMPVPSMILCTVGIPAQIFLMNLSFETRTGHFIILR